MSDNVRFEVWVDGYDFGHFETLSEAERAVAERPPTAGAELLEVPADAPTWRPGDGPRPEKTLRSYPPTISDVTNEETQ